jgi:hypothetical protein
MKPLLALLVLVAVVAAGCGGSKNASTPTTTAAAVSTTAPTTGTSASPSPLQAEAKAAATGDVPDNQVFLRFADPAAGYSMKYPEGWAKQGSGSTVTFRDKNNIVRVVVAPGGRPTAASVRADLRRLTGAHVQSGTRPLTINGVPAFKVVYTTASTPNAVTGKRVTLMVDRYYLSQAGKEAIVDLGTPVGVDNVDAYRLMIESFRWR